MADSGASENVRWIVCLRSELCEFGLLYTYNENFSFNLRNLTSNSVSLKTIPQYLLSCPISSKLLGFVTLALAEAAATHFHNGMLQDLHQ